MKRIVKKPVVVEKIVEKVTEMKNELVEDNTSEFHDLLGKNVCIFGAIYIYSGTLVGVNSSHIVLEDAHVVYETGAFTLKEWKDAQKLPTGELKIRMNMIESFFEVVRS